MPSSKKKAPKPSTKPIDDSVPGIYEVKGMKYTDNDPDSSWSFTETVTANCAEDAINKVRKHFVGTDCSWENDEDGGVVVESTLTHILVKSVSFIVGASIK